LRDLTREDTKNEKLQACNMQRPEEGNDAINHKKKNTWEI
jgi:hypothetical protein